MDTGSIDLQRLLAETEWLRRLVRSLMRDAASADDICQDTMLAACQRPLRGNLRAWLARVARSKVARFHVRSLRRQAREQRAARPEAQPPPSDTLQQFQLQLVLTRELDALAEPYRTAILLRVWDDLPPREVARRTGAPVETVRTRIRRGLAELRARLDRRCGGRAAWAVPLGSWSALPVHGPWLLLGGWMSLNAKLLFASAVVLLGALAAWPLFTAGAGVPVSPAEPPATGTAQRADAPVAEHAAAQQSVPAVPPARTEVAPEPRVPDEEPVLVQPFDLHVRVQDEGAQPVADASVALWLAHRVSHDEHGNGYQARLSRAEPHRSGSTDVRGELTLRVDREMLYARASKEGAGASSDAMVGSLQYAAGKTLLLTLEPQVTLHGEVYAHDGRPVSAPIECEVRRIMRAGVHMPGEQRWSESALVSNADGRFTAHLDVGFRFAVVAVQGKDRSFEAVVDCTTAGERSVRLEFPGRYGIRGFVLDEGGTAAVARVLVREKRSDTTDYKSGYEGHRGVATSDGNGRFLAFVPKSGRYELLALAPGHAASEQDEVLVQDGTADGPTLRLMAPGKIEGRVIDAAGKPVAGARLELVGLAEPPIASPWSVSAAERYGHFKAASGDDGGFAFTTVHPLASYRLECLPDPRQPMARLAPQTVRAGAGPVTFVLPAAGLGHAVSGAVTDAATGKPITQFTLRIVTTGADGSLGLSYPHRFDDPQGNFRVDEVPAGKQVQLIVRAAGYAEAAVAVPEAPAAAPLAIALPRPASLSVLVLDAQGLPVAGARVSIAAQQPLADAGLRFGDSPLADASGRLEQKQLDPGIYDVRASSRDGKQRAEQKDLAVAPGSSGSLTLQLQ